MPFNNLILFQENDKNINLTKAIELVKDGNTLRFASSETGIPFSTIREKIKKNITKYEKPGPPPILNQGDEISIANIIQILIRRAMNPRVNDVLEYANTILVKFYKSEHVQQHFPLKRKWFLQFLSRFPHLTTKKVKYCDKAACRVTEASMRHWFRWVLKKKIIMFVINLFISQKNFGHSYSHSSKRNSIEKYWSLRWDFHPI